MYSQRGMRHLPQKVQKMQQKLVGEIKISSSEHSGLDVLMISEISMVGVPAAAALPVIVSSSSVSVLSMIVGGIFVVMVLSVGAAAGTVYVSVGAAVSAA